MKSIFLQLILSGEFSGCNLDVAMVVYGHSKWRCVGRRLHGCILVNEWKQEGRRNSQKAEGKPVVGVSAQFHICSLRH